MKDFIEQQLRLARWFFFISVLNRGAPHKERSPAHIKSIIHDTEVSAEFFFSISILSNAKFGGILIKF